MANGIPHHYLHFTIFQITNQHHKYSFMYKLPKEQSSLKENERVHCKGNG